MKPAFGIHLLAVAVWSTTVLLAGPGFADAPATVELAAAIRREKPIDFVYLKTPNPWSARANSTFLGPKFHRLYVLENPTPGSLEFQILQMFNDPKNPGFVLLRQYVRFYRRTMLQEKSRGKFADDPYRTLTEDTPVYFSRSNLFGLTGPMTHINLPNLLLPAVWAERVIHQAKASDGKVIYAYLSLADGAERGLEDIWQDQPLFRRIMTHLVLRLLEAETRGQKRGLEAHMGAHTGPEVNLAFASTWCQNRGFYEGWALAHYAFLHHLFPKEFPLSQATGLREKDRFLVFPSDPWKAGFSPLATIAESWNTPQAVFNVNQANAWFLHDLLTNPRIAGAWEKSVGVLARQGAGNLRQFAADWVSLFSDDRQEIVEALSQVTHELVRPTATELFPCMGPEIWVGTPPDRDQVEFNGGTRADLNYLLTKLAETLDQDQQTVWLQVRYAHGVSENHLSRLVDDLIDERGKRCGQFKDIWDVARWINFFGRNAGIGRVPRWNFIAAVVRAKMKLSDHAAQERRRLQGLGAYPR